MAGQLLHRAIAQIASFLVIFSPASLIPAKLTTTAVFLKACERLDQLYLLDSEGSLWKHNQAGLAPYSNPAGLTACRVTNLSSSFYGTDSGLVLRLDPEAGLSTLYLDLIPVLSEDAQTAVIGLVEVGNGKIVIGCPLHLVIAEEGLVQVVFDMKMSLEVLGIGPGVVAAVRTYQDKVTIYAIGDEDSEEEYEDDFEPEEVAVQIPRSSELTVVMKFEPSPRSLLSFISSTSSSKRPKKKTVKDLPVTFHKKVKSSGYGSSNKATAKKQPTKRTAPIMESLPVSPDPANTWTGGKLYNSAVFQLAFSPDGTRLGVCGSESTCFLVKLPVSRFKGERTPLIGHEQSVTSLSWSSNSSLVLTSSQDHSVKLWAAAGSNPGLCLFTLPCESLCSQLYYQDRFIAVTDVEKVKLFTYKLTDPNEKDDVKRLQARCKYKERGHMAHPSAQTVTCFAAQNLFHSHLMLLAGSNKVISVWDIDKLAEARQIDDPHRKSIHCLRLLKPSLAVSSPNYDSGNLFLTAAADNEIHIWDLRQAAMVMQLAGHTNSAQEINGDFSPTGLLVAYGSEDRAAYMWDLRTARLLERLRGFRDVVSSVDFAPAGGLGVGSFDSSIEFYTGS